MRVTAVRMSHEQVNFYAEFMKEAYCVLAAAARASCRIIIAVRVKLNFTAAIAAESG